MTRETKVGLIVAASFVGLVCIVVVSKIGQGTTPGGPEEQQNPIAAITPKKLDVKPAEPAPKPVVPTPVPAPKTVEPVVNQLLDQIAKDGGSPLPAPLPPNPLPAFPEPKSNQNTGQPGVIEFPPVSPADLLKPTQDRPPVARVGGVESVKPDLPPAAKPAFPPPVEATKPTGIEAAKPEFPPPVAPVKPTEIGPAKPIFPPPVEPTKPTGIESVKPAFPPPVEPTKPTGIESVKPAFPPPVEPTKPTGIESVKPAFPPPVEPTKPTGIESGKPAFPPPVEQTKPAFPPNVEPVPPAKPAFPPGPTTLQPIPKFNDTVPMIPPPGSPIKQEPTFPTGPTPTIPRDSAPGLPTITVGGKPAVTMHQLEKVKIESGESSFAALSKRLYGDEKYAEALQAYNRDNYGAIANGNNLKLDSPVLAPGQQVLHPPLNVLERDYRPLIATAAPSIPAPPPVTVAPPVKIAPPSIPPTNPVTIGSPDRVRVYVVQNPAGERLRDIAQRQLGDPNRWPAIYRINNIQPQFPIPAGTQLKIPVE